MKEGLFRRLVIVIALAVGISDASTGQGNLPEIAKAPEWTTPPSKVVNLNHPEKVANEYIVVFKDDDELAKDVPPAILNSLDLSPGELPTTKESITRIGLSLAGRFRSKAVLPPGDDGNDLHIIKYTFTSALRGFSLNGVSDKDVSELAKDPRIKYVEAVLKGRAQTIQNSAPWDLDRIDQSSGLDGLYHYSATGAGVTIWVIDTGIQFSHHDFGGRAGGQDIYFVGCGMGQDCSNYYKVCTTGNGSCHYYYPYAQTNPGFADTCGHGTAVASAAAGNVSGVAKGATLIGIDVESDSNCDIGTDEIVAAIDYVLNHKGAHGNVINLSIEIAVNDQFAPAFENAVAAAVNSGVVFVTAAGNDPNNNGFNACSFDPGRLSYVITVGASSKNDLVSTYSNFGPCITLFAPGDHVTVADNGYDANMDTKGTPQGSNTALNTISGTSLSAPIVAGISALYLQSNPGATPAAVKSAITSAAWVGKLKDTRPGVIGSANLLASPCVAGNAVCASGTGSGGGTGGSSSIPTVLAVIETILLLRGP